MERAVSATLSEINGVDSAVSDTVLVELIRSGSQYAATKLYRRYAPRIWALARSRCSRALAPRLDAEDIVQSVFRRFFGQVSEGNYQAPDGETLWGLFLAIALNKIRSAERYHRAERRDVTKTVSEDEDVAGSSQQWMELAVRETLEQLPPRHREAVALRVAGWEIGEIARHLKRSLRTTERQLQEARHLLEGQFRRDEIG